MADASKVINGTYGTVWVNGQLWAEVDKLDAKITPKYDVVNFANDPAVFQKGVGWESSGTMTIKKVYSRVQNAAASEIRKGKFPRFEIVSKLADPDAYGAQRVALHDVTFDEVQLIKFDQKTLEDETIPFKFSDYEMLDTIADPTT